ncbi:hypothetical protein AOLI_G00211430 [Acnodon oligacanthus]
MMVNYDDWEHLQLSTAEKRMGFIAGEQNGTEKEFVRGTIGEPRKELLSLIYHLMVRTKLRLIRDTHRDPSGSFWAVFNDPQWDSLTPKRETPPTEKCPWRIRDPIFMCHRGLIGLDTTWQPGLRDMGSAGEERGLF